MTAAAPGDWVDPREWNEHSRPANRFVAPLQLLGVSADHCQTGVMYTVKDVSGRVRYLCSAWFSEWEGIV